MEEVHSGRLAAFSQNPRSWRRPGDRAGSRLVPAHWAARSMRSGAPRPRVSWTRLRGGGRGLLASPQGTALLQALPTSAGGNGLGTFPRGSVPAPPASHGLPSSRGHLRFPRGRPPFRPGPPRRRRRPLPAVAPPPSMGDLRTGHLGHSHEETSEETPADDRAARNGRGFLASSVAATSGPQ